MARLAAARGPLDPPYTIFRPTPDRRVLRLSLGLKSSAEEGARNVRKEAALSIVALILTIMGLGFLIVLWVSIAMSLVFLVRGGMARTFG